MEMAEEHVLWTGTDGLEFSSLMGASLAQPVMTDLLVCGDMKEDALLTATL